MSDTQPQPPHDDSRPTTATDQIETSPDVVNDPSSDRDVAGHGDPLDAPRTGEEIAADKMAEDSNDATDVNVLGDQDAVNSAGYQYPADAHELTARNVRRYPELFTDDQIASFDVVDEEADANAVVDDDDNADADNTDGTSLSTFRSSGF